MASKKRKSAKPGPQMLLRQDSELVLQVGPLGIYRGSTLVFEGRRDPTTIPYYTVLISASWLDQGGEVELGIEGNLRIAGTERALAEEEDLLVQVGKTDDVYELDVMNRDGELTLQLELERVPEAGAEKPN